MLQTRLQSLYLPRIMTCLLPHSLNSQHSFRPSLISFYSSAIIANQSFVAHRGDTSFPSLSTRAHSHQCIHVTRLQYLAGLQVVRPLTKGLLLLPSLRLYIRPKRISRMLGYDWHAMFMCEGWQWEAGRRSRRPSSGDTHRHCSCTTPSQDKLLYSRKLRFKVPVKCSRL